MRDPHGNGSGPLPFFSGAADDATLKVAGAARTGEQRPDLVEPPPLAVPAAGRIAVGHMDGPVGRVRQRGRRWKRGVRWRSRQDPRRRHRLCRFGSARPLSLRPGAQRAQAFTGGVAAHLRELPRAPGTAIGAAQGGVQLRPRLVALNGIHRVGSERGHAERRSAEQQQARGAAHESLNEQTVQVRGFVRQVPQGALSTLE